MNVQCLKRSIECFAIVEELEEDEIKELLAELIDMKTEE